MKARGAGRIVGMAMESFDSETEGSITVFVNPNFYSGVAGLQGATQTSGLIVDGTLATKDLSVSGTATIKTLDVAEIATIRTLNVSDTATVAHLVATAGVTTNTLDVKSTANLESVVVATNIELGGGIVKTFTAETALTAGQTVIATPDGHVTTTTTPADTRIVGIVLAAAEAHQPVKILIGGTAQVLIDGPATPGDLLGSSAVEGKATRLDPPKTGALLGKLLSPPDAQGRALVLISLD
jgi:hypothetical protein